MVTVPTFRAVSVVAMLATLGAAHALTAEPAGIGPEPAFSIDGGSFPPAKAGNALALLDFERTSAGDTVISLGRPGPARPAWTLHQLRSDHDGDAWRTALDRMKADGVVAGAALDRLEHPREIAARGRSGGGLGPEPFPEVFVTYSDSQSSIVVIPPMARDVGERTADRGVLH